MEAFVTLFFAPRLLCRCPNVVKPYELRLTLYRPIDLATLVQVCTRFTMASQVGLSPYPINRSSLSSRHRQYLTVAASRYGCLRRTSGTYIDMISCVPKEDWSRIEREVYIEDGAGYSGLIETFAIMFNRAEEAIHTLAIFEKLVRPSA